MDGTTAQETKVQTTQAPAKEADKFAGVNVPSPDKFTHSVEMRFGFRTIEDKESGVKTKRPEVNAKVPVLNFDGVAQILTDYATAANTVSTNPQDEDAKKTLELIKPSYDLLMSAVQGVYESAIKDFLGDNEKVTTQDFPYAQFTWEAIANQPESERRGRGIAKEIWEDFLKSYISVMPGAMGKDKKVIEKQATILGQKLNPLKNHEDKEKILPKFKDALTVYMNVAGEDAETYAACVDFLNKKIDSLLTSDKQADLAANLGFE
jgi:hypothetical protein